MDEALEGDVLVGVEVADDVLTVLDGRDQQVSPGHRVLGEEGYACVVPPHDRVLVAGLTSEETADEAARPGAGEVGVEVPGDSLGLTHAAATTSISTSQSLTSVWTTMAVVGTSRPLSAALRAAALTSA